MEQFSKKEFFDACTKVLGAEKVDAVKRLPTSTVYYLCEMVAQAMLLNELLCSESEVLRVIQVTAHHCWRDNFGKLDGGLI